MTAGIPGAGIGGLFYLLSALFMPFREMARARRGESSPESRRMVKRQTGIALGILLSMWATAWLLAFIISTLSGFTPIAGNHFTGVMRQDIPRFLSYSALAVGGITLGFILTGVQVLRLVAGRPDRLQKSPRPARILLLVCALSIPTAALAQGVAERLALADQAFKDEDAARAEREYRAILALDPDQSRATFRLARLVERNDPDEAESLYRRYIDLEPDDASGYAVLAEFLGRQSRYDQALDLYAEAIRIDPADVEAAYGYARMLARVERYKSASGVLVRAYGPGANPDVDDYRRYLDRADAPALEPVFGFSRDSDGNTKLRTAVGGDFAVVDGIRLGLSAGRTATSGELGDRSFSDFAIHARLRPRAVLRIDAAAGATRFDKGQPLGQLEAGSVLVPTGRVRLRFASPGNAARLDIRLNRTVFDVTPTLVSNRVVRADIQARPDIAVTRRFRLRGVGGVSRIDAASGAERNTRRMLGGGAAFIAAAPVEISANFTQIRYTRPSAAGYFAPRQIHAADFGSYMEFEGERMLVALDIGGGAERFQEHEAGFGSWRPTLRGYGMLSFRLRPGSELRFEVDSYNTQANTAGAPVSGWKYGSVTASLRFALPFSRF